MKKKNKFWKNKIYISLVSVIIIIGAAFLYVSNVHADPVTYYFNNAVNQSPGEQGNYWYDAGFTQPALELPDFNIDIVYVTAGAVFAGNARFNGPATNDGQVTGDASFYGASANNSQVDGNAEFYNDSTNAGTIGINATFYNDLSENVGNKGSSQVSGTQTRYYNQATTTVRDFTALAPWTVVADGVEVDVTGATFDGTTTFSAINGGSFIGAEAPVTYYFNNAVNTDPSEPGNYWSDADCTIPANAVPDFQVDEVFVGGCSNWSEQVFFNGDATFNGNATNKGTVMGNATFNDDSSNYFSGFAGSGQGSVLGNAVFNNNAVNQSSVEGDAEFYNSSQNSPDNGSGRGNVGGDAEFNDTSVNAGGVTGNAVFNNSAENTGTVSMDATFNNSSQLTAGAIDGNATFNGDVADVVSHGGSVAGTKTRRYSSNIATSRSFTIESPWTVLADGAVVNLTNASFNGTTTFTTLNGGSFVFPTPVLNSAIVKAKKITLAYNRSLDTGSVPAANDYAVLLNGIPVSVSSVSVTGSSVVLTLNLSENATINDVIIFDYIPGTNPVRIGPNAEAAALNDQATTITSTITIGGGNTGDILAVGTTVYAATTNSTVAVVDTLNLTVNSFINVGATPGALTLVGTKMYVLNRGASSVSVVNTLTNTVSSTIIVGSAPYGAALVGNKLYVANSNSSSVSVINTLTNTVVGTISVGSGPRNPVLVGTKLYVNNYNGSSISVIDTLTDTVSTTISVGSSPQNMARIGSKLYVVNAASSTIKVIDLTTDTVISTITSTGSNFRSTTVFRNKLYVTDSANNQVVIVDSTTDTITGTIATSTFPNISALIDDKLLIGNFVGGGVSIINPLTDTVINTIVSSTTVDFSNIGSTVYMSNQSTANLTISNLKALVSQLPNLVSFSSSASSGTYAPGQTIGISATFARALQAGSTMTVSLNTGASVVLDSVSGGTLSGTYTIGSGETTPDLSVTAITAASISDLEAHSRTSYSLNSSIASSDADNLSIVRNIGDTKNIVVGTYATMATGQQPQHISQVVTIRGIEYLYITNKTDNTVSVIRKSDGATAATISVGSEPSGIIAGPIGSVLKVFVANSGSNTVSVIDAETNTVSATITVGNRPSHFEFIEPKMYVSNNESNTVSVINTANNTVSSTIAVGLRPRGMRALGTNLYVANYGDPNIVGGNYVSVIDTVTDTVSDTILQPVGSAGNYGIAEYGRDLYLSNYLNNTVSVIDADTKALKATIAVTGGPRDIFTVNNTVFVSAFDGGTIWAIDPNTYLEKAIIGAGHSPMGMSSSGNFLYYTRYQDNYVSLVNLSHNTLSTVLTETNNSGGGGAGVITQTPRTETPGSVEAPSPQNPVPPEQNQIQGPIDSKLSNRLKGRLLLAVNDHGKIWYVDTIHAHRYQVAVASALDIFRHLALGINNRNLSNIPMASSRFQTLLGNRLKGKLLLQVENRGVIWYVDMNGRRHLVTVGNVLDLFRRLSLGITNENLDKIKVGDLN